MLVVTFALLALAVVPESGASEQGESVHTVLREESPDVFLAKATLRQYLERAARKDWDGVRRLTHPKALPSGGGPRRRGNARDLPRWQDDEPPETLELRGAPLQMPGGKARLSFLVGRLVIEGGFAELESETRALGQPIEGKRVTVTQIYEFANTLSAAIGAIDTAQVGDDLRYAFAEAGDMLVQGFAPMMPHLAEECWAALGHDALVSQSPWPAGSRRCCTRALLPSARRAN